MAQHLSGLNLFHILVVFSQTNSMVETTDNSITSEENVRKVRLQFAHSLDFELCPTLVQMKLNDTLCSAFFTALEFGSGACKCHQCLKR